MSIVTPEQIESFPASDFNTVEGLLNNGDSKGAQEAMHEWTDEPGQHLGQQLEELAKLYDGQATAETLQWQGDTIDFTRFTTQDVNEEASQPSEVCWLIDRYSSDNKEYHTRSYAIDLNDGHARTRVEVEDNGETLVYTGIGDTKRPVADDVAREQIIFDVFCHLLVAHEKMLAKPPHEVSVSS